MRITRHPRGKRAEPGGFTLIESFFVLVAVTIISFILIGLYMKNSRPPAPAASSGPPAPAAPAASSVPPAPSVPAAPPVSPAPTVPPVEPGAGAVPKPGE